jgi:hypothetical protein
MQAKTAPTIQKQPIQNYKVSFSIRLNAFQASGQQQFSYIGSERESAKMPIGASIRASARAYPDIGLTTN